MDISTVRVRFNGFPISQHPEFAEAEVAYENDSTASPVLVRISFNPGFRPGRYDIFEMCIRDRVGRPSLETLITESLDSLGGSDKGMRMPTKDALLVLANGVLLKGRSIQKARQDLALSLKPVITVVDSDEMCIRDRPRRRRSLWHSPDAKYKP